MPVAVEDDDATGEQRAAGLRYEESGEGPDLVLLHGFGGCLEHWNPVVGKLATERHVVAVDLPGFGRSEPWGRGQTVLDRHLVDRVEAFLDAVGLEAPAVAGNSLGGVVALELAKRRRASSVTVLSPAAFIDGASKLYVAGMLGGLQGIARVVPSPLVDAALAGPADPPRRRCDSWSVVRTISTRASCDRPAHVDPTRAVPVAPRARAQLLVPAGRRPRRAGHGRVGHPRSCAVGPPGPAAAKRPPRGDACRVAGVRARADVRRPGARRPGPPRRQRLTFRRSLVRSADAAAVRSVGGAGGGGSPLARRRGQQAGLLAAANEHALPQPGASRSANSTERSERSERVRCETLTSCSRR